MAGRSQVQVPKWWIVNGPRRDGPYDQAFINACLRNGDLSPNDLAIAVGTAQQKPLRDWPEFAPVVQEIAATTPPPAAIEPAPRVSAISSSAPPNRPILPVQQVREALVNYALHEKSSLIDIPIIVEFRRAHREIQVHFQKANERFQQVTKAIAAYSPFEIALGRNKKDLAVAESDLGKMAQSLGNAAFHAFLAGKVRELPVFAERLDLFRKIADMESEKQSLDSPDTAGMIQRTTAKGQQLIVAGKIKLAAMSESSLEATIGRNLLHTNQEESVFCEQTSNVLDRIRKQRSSIASLRLQLSEAETALEHKRMELCHFLGLEKIEGKSTLDAELRKCQSVIRQKEKERIELEERLPDRFLAEPSLPQQGPLAEMLADLQRAASSPTIGGNVRDARPHSASSLLSGRLTEVSLQLFSVVSRARIIPLAVCTLGLGWIFKFVMPDRFFLPKFTVLIPILLLAVPSMTLAVLSAVFFVRPNDVASLPTKRCLLALAFTMIAGLAFLLFFQEVASFEAHSSRPYTAGPLRLYEGVVKFIGWCYESAESPNLAKRFVGCIFGIGLCEEFTKLLPLFYFALKKSSNNSANPLTYRGFLLIGFFSGLGFGIGEALYCYSPWGAFQVCQVSGNVLRWFACVPSHAIYGMIDAAALWYLLPVIKASSNVHAQFALCAAATGIIAIVHGIYDALCGVRFIGLIMDALSLVLLCWLVRLVAETRGEGEVSLGDGSLPSGPTEKLLLKLKSEKRLFPFLYATSVVFILMALIFSWSAGSEGVAGHYGRPLGGNHGSSNLVNFPLTWDRLLDMTGRSGPNVRISTDGAGNIVRVMAMNGPLETLVIVEPFEDGFAVTPGNMFAVSDFTTRPWFSSPESDRLQKIYANYAASSVQGMSAEENVGRYEVRMTRNPAFSDKPCFVLLPRRR